MASRFKYLRDVKPQVFATTWQELRQALSKHVEREDKTRGSLWSPAVYKQGAKRGNAGVESLWCFVADLDGQSLQRAQRSLSRLTYLAYTTYSHREGDEHWHVVIPLSRSVSADEWQDVWVWANSSLGLNADEKTCDPARIFFEPQHAKGNPFAFVANDGKLLTPPKQSNPSIRSRATQRGQGSRSASLKYLMSEEWWNAPIDMSQYDGMTQEEIHRDMQREWAALRARMRAE
jgi:hypothetical protein